MLGAAHALANPLTALLGVPHGQAVGLMMPHVIRFNSYSVGDRYSQLAKLLPDKLASGSTHSASDTIARVFTQWMKDAALALSLQQLPQWPAGLHGASGKTDLFLRELACSAAKQWTASFNPRVVTESDMFEIYRAALV